MSDEKSVVVPSSLLRYVVSQLQWFQDDNAEILDFLDNYEDALIRELSERDTERRYKKSKEIEWGIHELQNILDNEPVGAIQFKLVGYRNALEEIADTPIPIQHDMSKSRLLQVIGIARTALDGGV